MAGQSTIEIKESPLGPYLEDFLYEVLKRIQARANEYSPTGPEPPQASPSPSSKINFLGIIWKFYIFGIKIFQINRIEKV